MSELKVKNAALVVESPKYKAGQIFAAKKEKVVNSHGEYNDRQILYVTEFRHIVKVEFVGYNPEFTKWCEESSFRFAGSSISELEFESETNKPAKLYNNLFDYLVQYDTPSLARGCNYPSIPQSKFEAWAGKEVTDITPKGEWRTSKIKSDDAK